MNRAPRLFFIAEPEQPLSYDILQIGLPDIDHVVDGLAAAKCRMIRPAAAGSCHPDVLFFSERVIFEVLIEEAELPELVRNVFTDISHSPIGTDNDLVLVVAIGFETHDPTALVLSFGL